MVELMAGVADSQRSRSLVARSMDRDEITARCDLLIMTVVRLPAWSDAGSRLDGMLIEEDNERALVYPNS